MLTDGLIVRLTDNYYTDSDIYDAIDKAEDGGAG